MIRPNSFDAETFLSGQNLSGSQDQRLQALDGIYFYFIIAHAYFRSQQSALENSDVAGIATISASDLTLVTYDNSFNEGTQNTSFSWTPCHSLGFSLENQ